MARGRVRTVSVRVTANISDLEKKMRAVSAKMRKVGQTMTKTGTAMTKAFTVPVVAATAAIAKLTQSSMSYANTIDKMSVRTGIGTDKLQELKFVTDQVGVSFESIEKGVTYLTRRMNSAEKGTGDYHKIFKALKIEMEDNGKLRNVGDIFQETIQKLANLEDPTRQAMLAVKLFGTQANELMPLLRAGGEEVDRLTNRFRDLELGMSKQQLDSFVKLKDRLAELSMRYKKVGYEITAAFLPVSLKVAEYMEKRVIPAIHKLTFWFKNLDASTKKTTLVIIGLTAVMGPLIIMIGKVTAALSFLIAHPVIAGIAAIGALVAVVATATGGFGHFEASQRKLQEAAIRTNAELIRQKQHIDNLGQSVLTMNYQEASRSYNQYRDLFYKIGMEAEELKQRLKIVKTGKDEFGNYVPADEWIRVESKWAAARERLEDARELMNKSLKVRNELFNLESPKYQVPDLGIDDFEKLFANLNAKSEGTASKIDTVTDSVRRFVTALKEQTQSYLSWSGLFDRANVNMSISGDRWLNRLKGQVRAMSTYQQSMAMLQAKAQQGVISQGLLEQLQSMGPAGARQLQSILRMSDTKLSEASSLFGQKTGFAESMAFDTVMGQRAKEQAVNQIVFQITGNTIMADDETVLNKLTSQIINALKTESVLN